MALTSKSGEPSGSWRLEQVNLSVYEMNRPVGKPSIQVLFFHGLLLEGDYSEAHWLTWRSEDGSCCWPQTWLTEEIPGAHMFSVSCSGCLGKSATEHFDLFLQAENLISDILEAEIGQDSRCPVVLVGHSIGGLVIKEVCCQAYQKVVTSQGMRKTRLKNFLQNLRGVFYYATPHRGSPVAEQLADIIGIPLLNYFKALSKDAARLEDEFEKMCSSYDICQFANLGENLPTKLGLLGEVRVVPEASARGSDFNTDEKADHFSICRPKNKLSRGFRKLKQFLSEIASDMRVRGHPDNFQRLPKTITGIKFQLQEVKSKLKDVKSLGLVGMGGLGKTTLAMALFNDLCLDFEYTCFIPRVKDKVNNVEVEALIWKNMYFMGKKFGDGEPEWSKLTDQRLLVVLDDIAGDCNISTQFLDDTSSESRFIVTSRERDLLGRSVDAVHEVQFLEAESAQRLLLSHAFPNQEMAPASFTHLMESIVRKCEGLPLTVQVIGQFLKGKHHVDDWMQTLNALSKAKSIKGFDERLWAKLRISYDGLKMKEQKMFLDATEFFCRRQTWSLRDAKAAWSSAYDTDSVNNLWQTLVDICLVYQIEDDEYIRVHEQLQSLGRRIADEPRNEYRCRLWDIDSIREGLQDELQLVNAAFNALGVCRGGLRGSCPFRRKVDQADLESSAIISSQQEALSFLRTLFEPEHLELHGSFPYIQSRLVHLSLWNCFRMQSFPSYIWQLSAVRELHLSNWGRNTHIPDDIGQLSQLEFLTLETFRFVQELPDTLGQLSHLTHLTLRSLPLLRALPESIWHLSMLQNLTVSECQALKSLPDSFGQLLSLKDLELTGCFNLNSLPASFGQLPSLKRLKLTGCHNLHSLPASFGQLPSLKHLELTGCSNLHSLSASFGQLPMLEILELTHLSNVETLSESLAELKNLFHLAIRCLPLRTIPDLMCLGSLHSLTLGDRPYSTEAPPWLENVHPTDLSMSWKITLEKSDGKFSFMEKTPSYMTIEVVKMLHGRAMDKVEASDYKGAVWDLCANLVLLPPYDRAFLLQERGIAKRLVGDFRGALDDLVAALTGFKEVSGGYFSAYECRKHLGFVKFLLGDLNGAQRDGEIALESGPSGGRFRLFRSLGEEPVTYLHFRLKGSGRYEYREMTSPQHQVMEKVKAAEFTTALAIWEDFDARVLGCYNQQHFLQERGILRRLVGNLTGSVEDLSKSLAIDPDDYDCIKHLAYVKYLLGNLEEARMGARRCMALEPEKCTHDEGREGIEEVDLESDSLGGCRVAFLGFNLG